MGYRIHVLDPDAECSAAPVADRVIAARFDDVDAASELARHADVVTLEIEQIAIAALEAARRHAPLRPGVNVIGIIQDRARQKEWLRENGFPVGDYVIVRSAAEVASAVSRMGDTFVKSVHGGYDGRSQVRLREAAQAHEAWKSLGERTSVAERGLELAGELSVMVARRPSGETRVYPAAMNHHERQILAWSVIPAPLEPALLRRATELGRAIAERVGLEGILGIELFLTTGGELLVNELAPRPHNSYHASERGCVTGQFEQIVRAVCDLPLGDVSVVRPAAIVNLFGDLWSNGHDPAFGDALENPVVRLHLYGKRGARPGRKMGHLSAVGGSTMDALEAARAAAQKIGANTEPVPDTLRPFLSGR